MMFAAYLASTPARRHGRSLHPRSAATIEAYVSTVRSYLAALGGFPLAESLPRWRRFVRGLRRIYGGGERRLTTGLRASHLRRAFDGADQQFDAALANAWALLAFGWQRVAAEHGERVAVGGEGGVVQRVEVQHPVAECSDLPHHCRGNPWRQ